MKALELKPARSLGEVAWTSAQLILTITNVVLMLNFSAEAYGRFYLWAAECRFQPYLNHMDDPTSAFRTGIWTLPIVMLVGLTLRNSKRPIKGLNFLILCVVAVGFLLCLLMIRFHGLVSYEEFVQHGV